MRKKLVTAAAALFVGFGAMAAVTPPSFPGGEEALQEFVASHLQYPERAKECGIEGVVNVGFIVTADGKIGTIKIKRMIDPDLEQEAVRIVKAMPAWTPAMDNGKPVESEAEVSVDFKLGE